MGGTEYFLFLYLYCPYLFKDCPQSLYKISPIGDDTLVPDGVTDQLKAGGDNSKFSTLF